MILYFFIFWSFIYNFDKMPFIYYCHILPDNWWAYKHSIIISILLFRTKESLFLILRGFTSHHCKIYNLERVHFYEV